MFFSPAQAAGIIDDAPRLSSVLLKATDFLLSIVGIIVILCIVVVGIIYLTAGGNQERVDQAKRATVASITGIVIASELG